MEFVDSELRKDGYMFLSMKSYEAVMINIEILLFKTIVNDTFKYFEALKDFNFIMSKLIDMLNELNISEQINKNHLISVPVPMVQKLAVELSAVCDSWNENYQEVDSFNDRFHKINKLLEAIIILNSDGHEIPMIPPGTLDDTTKIELSN